MDSVSVYKIGKAGRTPNSSDTDDLLVWNPEFLDNIKKGSKHCEIAASRTPSRFICFELLLCKLFGGSG
jgi:hypothetical protein